jgi:hypothetical protein
MLAGSGTFWLWIEGVNFDATVFDCDDISAIRGASHALIELPNLVFARLRTALPGHAVEPVLIAGSQGLALVTAGNGASLDQADIEAATRHILRSTHETDEPPADLDGDALLEALLPHLCFAVAVVPDTGNYASDRSRLRRAAAVAQFQSLTVDVPPPPDIAASEELAAMRPCRVDGFRPRTTRYWTSDGTLSPLSHAVACRRVKGRGDRRKAFYQNASGFDFAATGGKASFANMFEELVEKPPAGVAEQMQRKMAVLYLDGNEFGSLREESAVTKNGEAAFADAIGVQRRAMLGGVLEAIGGDRDLQSHDPEKAYEPDGQQRELPVYRFETLMWGADESLFVFPAWGIKSILNKLAELLEESRTTVRLPSGAARRLTYAAGLVICNVKTPIRLVKTLAIELAESAKDHSRQSNVLQYYALGQLELPTAPLEEERQRLYGMNKEVQDSAFTLSIDSIPALFDQVRNIKGVSGQRELGIPRQQLISLIRPAVEEGYLGSGGASRTDPSFPTEVEDRLKELEDLLSAPGYCKRDEITPITPADVLTQELRGIDRHPLMAIHHALSLWSLIREDGPSTVAALAPAEMTS